MELENKKLLFTGIFDLDSLILNNLSDTDLQSVCQINKAAKYICNNEYYWMNRTLWFYGKWLGNVEQIIEYKKQRSWKEYYQYLSQNKTPTYEQIIDPNNEDILKLFFKDRWSPERARKASEFHQYIKLDITPWFMRLEGFPIFIRRLESIIFVPALRLAGDSTLVRLYMKALGFSNERIEELLETAYTKDNYNTTLKDQFDAEIKAFENRKK